MSEEYETALEAGVVAEDLMRLSRRLQKLARTMPAEEPVPAPCSKRFAGQSYVEVARRIYDMRRRRNQFWPDELFADPAWDILLDLYIQHADNREVSTTGACVASGVPHTTALRWLAVLEEHNLVERYSSAHDKRVHYVRLSTLGARKLHDFLEATERQAEDRGQPFLLRLIK